MNSFVIPQTQAFDRNDELDSQEKPFPKNRKEGRKKVLSKKKNKDVLVKIDKDDSEGLDNFLLDLNAYNKPNITSKNQQFLSNFSELLKNHHFSSGKEASETRVETEQFSSDFMKFLNRYGIGFANKKPSVGKHIELNLPGTMNPFTKDCAKRTLEEMMKHYDDY